MTEVCRPGPYTSGAVQNRRAISYTNCRKSRKAYHRGVVIGDGFWTPGRTEPEHTGLPVPSQAEFTASRSCWVRWGEGSVFSPGRLAGVHSCRLSLTTIAFIPINLNKNWTRFYLWSLVFIPTTSISVNASNLVPNKSTTVCWSHAMLIWLIIDDFQIKKKIKTFLVRVFKSITTVRGIGKCSLSNVDDQGRSSFSFSFRDWMTIKGKSHLLIVQAEFQRMWNSHRFDPLYRQSNGAKARETVAHPKEHKTSPCRQLL